MYGIPYEAFVSERETPIADNSRITKIEFIMFTCQELPFFLQEPKLLVDSSRSIDHVIKDQPPHTVPVTQENALNFYKTALENLEDIS